jgi:TRAP-type C4-dicarboxylate transport system substrate-binding protein
MRCLSSRFLCSVVVGGLISLSALSVCAEEPQWNQLPHDEQQILAPLAKEWNQSNDRMRRRWRHLAKRYPTLSPDAQHRVHERLEHWASLSPEARADARRRFKRLNKELPHHNKASKWDDYQQLPEDEKNALAQQPPHAGHESK